ncbi:hypothetical protein [Cedecea neteri]|uniref:hypothetical protein n=1 Tax=Cedecea neteri TaxID=158822 RepID=UPI0028A1ACF1|nr:hypothetical protein [Cedecea neteri]
MTKKTELTGEGFESFVTPGTQVLDASRGILMTKPEAVTCAEGEGPALIDTFELLGIINAARREYDEPEISHNKFVKKVERELEGEFYPEIPKPSTERGGRPTVAYGLTNDQCMLVSMRESKAVRRSALAKLKARNVAAPALSTLEILQIAMASEQGRIEAEKRADEAERTKAEIGNRREATAMATASAAVRKSKQLAERLGEHEKHATVKAVKKITDIEYPWRPLKKWCEQNGMEPHKVPDNQFGFVKSWPCEAWLAVYGVDLTVLYGGEYA